MTEPQSTTETKQTNGAENVRWDLADLYAGPDDPAIEADFETSLAAAQAFQEKYRGRIAAGEITPEEFLSAVEEIEQIYIGAHKAAMYADLIFSVDTAEPAHGALVQRTSEQVTQVQNALLFFDVEWRQADDAFAQRILAHPPLARYAHSLAHERVFAPHTLTEAEEKLDAEKAPHRHQRFPAALRRAHQPVAADRDRRW